jgi:hypothetical protein
MKLHNIDNVTIPFDESWTDIAISLSGGADSALLAFLLCGFIKTQTVHIISHKRMWKTRPWQSYDSLTVFNWLKERFPNIKFERHTNFIAPDVEYGNMGPIIKDEYGKMVSGDNAQQRAYAEYICYYYNINAYYNAVTHNPREADLGGMLERNVEPTDDNKHLEITQHMGRWALHPFRFVDKSWVVKQYKDFNIWDLFERTRSCEGEFAELNYTSYTEGTLVPECGQCFWCREKAWAIKNNS